MRCIGPVIQMVLLKGCKYLGMGNRWIAVCFSSRRDRLSSLDLEDADRGYGANPTYIAARCRDIALERVSDPQLTPFTL